MLASLRITVSKKAVLHDCRCGSLAVMSTAKSRCIRCGGSPASGRKPSRNRGRN